MKKKKFDMYSGTNKRAVRDLAANFYQFVDYIYLMECDNDNMEICRLCDELKIAIDATYCFFCKRDEDLMHYLDLWNNAKKRALIRHMKKCRQHKVCPKSCWLNELDWYLEKLKGHMYYNDEMDECVFDLCNIMESEEWKNTM